MTDLKNVMAWVFAARSVLYLSISFREVHFFADRHHSNLIPRILVTFMFFSGALFSGTAWWTLEKKKPRARIWAIAASLASLADFLLSVAYAAPVTSSHRVIALAVGVFGLMVFLPDDKSGIQSPTPLP